MTSAEASKRTKNIAYIWENSCHPYDLWEWRKDVLDPLDRAMKDTANTYTMNKSNTNAIYLELNAPDGTKWCFKQGADGQYREFLVKPSKRLHSFAGIFKYLFEIGATEGVCMYEIIERKDNGAVIVQPTDGERKELTEFYRSAKDARVAHDRALLAGTKMARRSAEYSALPEAETAEGEEVDNEDNTGEDGSPVRGKKRLRAERLTKEFVTEMCNQVHSLLGHMVGRLLGDKASDAQIEVLAQELYEEFEPPLNINDRNTWITEEKVAKYKKMAEDQLNARNKQIMESLDTMFRCLHTINDVMK